MMRIYLTFLFAIFLGGCATGGWVKDGISQQEVNKDNYACLQEAQQRVTTVNQGTGSSTVTTNVALWEACLSARGYTYTDR